MAASGKTVTISIVVKGEAADGIISVWGDPLDVKDGIIPASFRRRIEEAIYMTVPSTVSRSKVQRGVKLHALYLNTTR